MPATGNRQELNVTSLDELPELSARLMIKKMGTIVTNIRGVGGGRRALGGPQSAILPKSGSFVTLCWPLRMDQWRVLNLVEVGLLFGDSSPSQSNQSYQMHSLLHRV